MTQQELTTSIHRALQTLRSVPGLPDSLDLDPAPLIDAALRIADQFADSKATDAASAIAHGNPPGTKAFLVVAERLRIEDAIRLAEFSSPSLAARNDIARAGLWVQGAVRDPSCDIASLMQSLARP